MNHIKFIHILITGILVGLIWTIQLVHYPTFHYIDAHEFVAFHQHHTFFISIIVAPLMIIELLLSIYMAYLNRKYVPILLIVLVIWLSTFLVQVPLHEKLKNGLDPICIDNLTNTNWIRTVLWSLKAAILMYWFITKKN